MHLRNLPMVQTNKPTTDCDGGTGLAVLHNHNFDPKARRDVARFIDEVHFCLLPPMVMGGPGTTSWSRTR
jgi:hypothetical protein